MRYLDVFSLTGSTSCMVRADAVALTLYVLAKSESAVTLNRSNHHAYAAE